MWFWVELSEQIFANLFFRWMESEQKFRSKFVEVKADDIFCGVCFFLMLHMPQIISLYVFYSLGLT